MIFDRVWGYDFGYGSNSLDVYISYLRKKTEAGGKPRLIHTVRGVGYALREPSEPSRARLGARSRRRPWPSRSLLASVVVYFIVQNELRGQVDRNLRDQVDQVEPAPGCRSLDADRARTSTSLHVPTAAVRRARSSSSTRDGGVYRRASRSGAAAALPGRRRRRVEVAAGERGDVLLRGRDVDGQHVRAAHRLGSPDGIAIAGRDAADERRPRARARSASGCCSSRSAAIGIAARRRLPRRARGAQAGARPERGGRARARDARPVAADRGRAAATSSSRLAFTFNAMLESLDEAAAARSASSSRTPRTSCARRSRACARTSRCSRRGRRLPAGGARAAARGRGRAARRDDRR